MKIRSVNKDDFKTTRWSGGTTTEFFIYPPGADYQKRKFAARISSAVIEDEYSKFTELPGVTRYLALLSGETDLVANGEKIVLDPYEIVKFSGTDVVESYGTCRDFNLMLKGVNGSMDCVRVGNIQTDFYIPCNMMVVIYNCSDDNISITGGISNQGTSFDQSISSSESTSSYQSISSGESMSLSHNISPGALAVLSTENEKNEEIIKISSDAKGSGLSSLLVCEFEVCGS